MAGFRVVIPAQPIRRIPPLPDKERPLPTCDTVLFWFATRSTPPNTRSTPISLLWQGLTAFFKYPVEFRRLIYTTNAIESLHSQMRKNMASRKMFPHDDAVIKILFLNIRNFSNRWSRRQGWDTVMNQLGVMCGDRLKPEVADDM
jgi:hypothetical protein